MNRTASRPRWVIVDDDEEIAWLVQHMLSYVTDAEIVRFGSGRAALRAFAAEPKSFDLVITDFNMPGMNGDELRQLLRKVEPSLKIVLATGNPDWNFRVALLRGFNGFLPKPFSISDVRDVALAMTPDTNRLFAA